MTDCSIVTSSVSNRPSYSLRRSINSFMNTSIVEMSNDEDERADRRSQQQIRKSLSNIPSPKITFNEAYVKEQFIMYTHMFVENKITAKNAWKLQIIDMLKSICKNSSSDVLQVAGTSIDISAKVYGIRVDDVHSKGLRLASSMARSSDKPVEPTNEEEEDVETEEVAVKKRRRKKYVPTGVKTTLNKNPSGNVGKLPKLEPVDFTSRHQVDTGSVDNLFTNMLTETSKSFILLDSSKRCMEKSDPILEHNCKIPAKNFIIPRQVTYINPVFNDFEVDEWDPEKEEMLLNLDKSETSSSQPVVYDGNGIPVHELDGSVHDIFDCDDINAMNELDADVVVTTSGIIENGIDSEFRVEPADVGDFKAMDSTQNSSEYSFNSIIMTCNGKYIDKIWAGPSHWKLKCIKRMTPRFCGQNGQNGKTLSRPKKRHIVEAIDFEDLEEDCYDFNYSNRLVIKKKPNSIFVEKITLPLLDKSCFRIMATIKDLMLKPGVAPVDKTTTSDIQVDYEVAPYNYENPNDSLYCARNQNDDDNNDADDNNYEEENPFLLTGSQGDGVNLTKIETIIQADKMASNLAEHLVDCPEMVPNSYLQFTSKAKPINMKRLKVSVWHALSNNKEDENKKVIPQKFSELYRRLPAFMMKRDREKLSCSLAFFALLHLANEQNLYLKRLPGNIDCFINRPEDGNDE